MKGDVVCVKTVAESLPRLSKTDESSGGQHHMSTRPVRSSWKKHVGLLHCRKAGSLDQVKVQSEESAL